LIENTIISSLVYADEYARKVIPYISPDYFEDDSKKVVVKLILSHYQRYNKAPTTKSLFMDLEKKNLPEHLFEKSVGVLDEIKDDILSDEEWLMDSTEDFCKQRALHNAILASIEKYDKKEDIGAIPDIITKALAVSFDNHIGHSYFDDADRRFEFYNRKEDKIPFDIDLLNKITNGGVVRKTMNIILAGTAVGKSMAMCHLAAGYISAGYNVLYITLEMAEEYIAERIDANLLDVNIKDIRELDKSVFNAKINSTRKKALGDLVIKEYPTGSAHAGHFRHLISELKLKKKFKPDVIMIDYLNICNSSRMKIKGSMYEFSKTIAEELRGLAIEENIALWTATQTNRDGYSSTDFDLTATSESFGVPMSADLMLALISTEELEKLRLLKVKQLKNRYGDVNYFKSFVVGMERAKMRLYDAEDSAQDVVTKEDGDTRDKSSGDDSELKAKVKSMFA
jgi:archaellum biogenesis ATPase FlaH